MDQDGNEIGVEKWLDYFKRSMSRAGSEIKKVHLEMGALIHEERKRWASHISRMGLDEKPEHLCKGFIAWRCKSWWNSQQLYNDLNWDTLQHQYPFYPRCWEDQLPNDWMMKFSNYPTTSEV